MHDPMTVAFQIKYPWRQKPSQFWPKGYRGTFATIWHVDPERDGSDDSCGWFMRSRHGDKRKLEKLEREFTYYCFAEHGGWFDLEGNPKFSPIAITLGMFRVGAYVHFDENWDKADRFVQKHLLRLVYFAENPIDSLFHSITSYYGKEPNEDRVHQFAGIVYGWILRAERPWYRHPRWHVHHWKIQIHPLQKLWRWLFERCSKCGKGYAYGYSPMGNWSGTATWHHDCERPEQELTGCAAKVEAK